MAVVALLKLYCTLFHSLSSMMPCDVVVPTCFIGVAGGVFRTMVVDALLEEPFATFMITPLFKTSWASPQK